MLVQPECPAKRLKTSNVISTELGGRKSCIVPVLSDVYTSQLQFVDVYVAEILNKKDASQIVRKLCDLFPLPNLQHLKRIRAVKQGRNLEVILCENTSRKESEVLTCSLLVDNVVSGLAVVSRLVSVVKTPPHTREQYESAVAQWPTLFHEDKWVTRALNGDLFTIDERSQIEEHMRTAIGIAGTTLGDEAGGRRTVAVGSVIVDPSSNTVVAAAAGLTRDNPLKHSVMVCIDLVSAAQGGGAWNKGPANSDLKSDRKSSVPYLCTGYDLYVTREPCLMCSMALVHSRIRRVFYGCENVQSGALGSVYKIHTQKEIVRTLQVPCPGLYCGRTLMLDGNWSSCSSCPRGSRPNSTSACTPCIDAPSFYDWLYLGFMALLPLSLHWFCIDLAAKRRSFTRGVLALHISAMIETVSSALMAVLFAQPRWTFKIDSCRVQRLSDWYTMLHNPNPSYEHTLHCTQEAVYPLYTIVFVYYALCLALLLLIRPVLANKCLPIRGKTSIYAAMYFIPILALLHAVSGGLLYYSFPYITIILSVISCAAHFAFQLDQSMKSLIMTTVLDVRNLVILFGHWIFHAYGIVAVAELRQLPFRAGFLVLVPLPVVFYIITARFTDPSKFHLE